MQSTWRDAFSYAWGNFTGVLNEGSARTLRLLFFLLFIAGSAFAVYNYLEMQKLKTEREERVMKPSVSTASVDADKNRLAKMVDAVRDASTRRISSSVTADNMRLMNKYVFDPPGTRLIEPDVFSQDIVVVPPPPQIERVYEPPPDITVKAIMLMGKTRVAVMDITGVGRGMLVRPGDSFLNRQGRIVRITDDKVVVRWKGKNWNVAPGF